MKKVGISNTFNDFKIECDKYMMQEYSIDVVNEYNENDFKDYYENFKGDYMAFCEYYANKYDLNRNY